MRVGIHQINYFPWLGYFNKIAKSDKFIFLDEVQLIDNGMMQRNRYLNKNGETGFFTVAFNKKDYLTRKFRDIEINPNVDWKKKQLNVLYDSYHKSPFWAETLSIIDEVFSADSKTLYGVNLTALVLICKKLSIDTPFVMQSDLTYDESLKKDDLLIALLEQVGADVYLSGTGAKKYMVLDDFHSKNIKVQFQTFVPRPYQQKNSSEFVPGLSILDVLFNCGVENTRMLFWQNIQNNEVSI